MENKIDKKKFGTNAIISKDNLGFLFVIPYLRVSRYGEFIIATNNTCNTYDAVNGSDDNNDFDTELITAIDKIKDEINDFNPKDNDEVEAKQRLLEFCGSLKKFMEPFKDVDALIKIIFPSHENNDNVLLDLSNCLPYKFRGFAFSFSGNRDNDNHSSIRDNQKMNLADLCGLGKIDFKNGSDLVSWLPTGMELMAFINSLKSLLKNVGYSFTNDEEYYGVYIIQSLMNIIFANNGYLPLSEINKIVNNYIQFVNGVFEEQKDLFNELRDILKESEKNKDEDNKQAKITENKDFYFIKFLFKKICVGTSLEKIDLDTEENKTEYFDPVIGVCGVLRGADHANQVLVLKKQNSDSTFGGGVILKNKNLYVPFYEILKRLSQSEKFRGGDNKFYLGKNSNESKALRQNLTFMINLAGKLRHTKTEFDLSKTKSQKEYKFGCQQNAQGDYLNPIHYDTDINAQKLINLTKQIIKFEKDVKENKIDLATLVKYLLDERFFGCIQGFDSECIKKIIENKELMNEFIYGANSGKRGPRCCKAYKIFVNEYFDFITDSKFINQEYLEDENLAKFFLRPENNEKIMELEPEKILKLNLISKLNVDVLNKFLRGSDKDKRKINKVLKLCVNRLESEKLSKLDFSKLDSEIIEAIILFKDKILSKDIVKNIDFRPLSLEAQVKLFNWIAQNNFDSFTKKHLEQINSDVFTDKSISVRDLKCFCEILHFGVKDGDQFEKFNRFDILKKWPVDLSLLYERIFAHEKSQDFLKYFLKQEIDRNTHTPVCSQLSNDQILSIGSFFTGSSQLDNFKSEKYIFKQLDSEIINDDVKKNVYDFACRFYGMIDSSCDIKKNVTNNLLLWLKTTRKLKNEEFSAVIKYVFDNHKNFRLYAFTILEFIMSDEIQTDKQDKKNNLEEIKQTIKQALNWDDSESRKKIIKNCFSCVDDINKFIDCIEYIDANNSSKCKDSLISMYKSFLNNLVAKYSDALEKNHVQQIPFYYLEKKNIELICTKYPGCVEECNFSALTKKFNSVKYSDSQYDCNHHHATFVDILNKFAGVAVAYEKNKDDNDEIFSKIDADYMIHIEMNMNKIRNGYWVDDNLVLERIKKNLGKYDSSKEKLTNQSPVYRIFKSLIDGNITVEKFVNQYAKNLDKNKLETILKNKNYDEFEEIFLPVIKKDWLEKDFKTFAKKYNLLKHIANNDTHTGKIVDLYVDFKEKKLNVSEFIVKHCLDYRWLTTEEKNKICEALQNIKDKKIPPLGNSNDSNQYTDEDKRHFVCCKLMQDFDDVKNNNLKKRIVDFLVSNIKLINNDVGVIIGSDEWKKFVQDKFDDEDEVKHLTEIKGLVSRFELISLCVTSKYNTTDNSNHWIEKILFGSSDDNAVNKLKQLSVVYDDYQKGKQKIGKEKENEEDTWTDFSEIHILKYISKSRIEQYVPNKKLDEQYKISKETNDRLKTLLTKFCRDLDVNYSNEPKKNKLQDIFSKLMDELDDDEKKLALEKFLEFAYQNKVFSNLQIKDTGVINFYNAQNGNKYTPGFIVKYLPLMLNCNKSIKSKLDDEEKNIIGNLHLNTKDNSYPENILCENIKDNKALAQIMEKIFFYQAEDIDSDNYSNGFLWNNTLDVSKQSQRQTDFRKFLRTQLLSLLGYTGAGKIKTGENDNKGTLMGYSKMTGDVYNQEDIYGFVLADFSFVSLVNSCAKDKRGENFDITEKLENLVANIRKRLKTILNYIDEKNGKQLKEILLKIINKNTLDLDLNELIARGFLRLESHECLSISSLSSKNADILYEKIISMLARCFSVEEFRNKKFNNVQEIKDWIHGSSLRYFVPSRLWCYEYGEAPPIYTTFFSKILMYILDKRGNISIVDILKNLYDPDAYENKLIYKCRICGNTLIRLFNELADETTKDNLNSNMQTLLRFLDQDLLKTWLGDKEQINILVSTINKFFKKGNILDENGYFETSQNIKIWLEYFCEIGKWLHLPFKPIIDDFCVHINFDKISVDDIINLFCPHNKFLTKSWYWSAWYWSALISKINKQIEKSDSKQINTDSIKKFIRFLCDTGYIVSNKFDNSICFTLFGKIIQIKNNNIDEDKDGTEIDKLIKNFDSIDVVLSQININEDCKTKLNELKNRYVFDYISRVNSVDELKKLLELVKQKNDDKFPNIVLNNKIKYDRILIYKCEILKDVFDKLEKLTSDKENPVEQVFDNDVFVLIVEFFGSLRFKAEISPKEICHVASVIVTLCPKEFKNAEQFNIYVNAIKQAFSTSENYQKLYQEILKKLLFNYLCQDSKIYYRIDKLSIFDVIYVLDSNNGLAFFSDNVNNDDFSLCKEWSDFLKEFNERIGKELGDNNQVKQTLTKQEDRFNILLHSALLQSSFMQTIKTKDISYVKTLLEHLSAIKNIRNQFNAKDDLEKYFNEIWKPVLDSDYWWQIRGDVSKEDYLKSNAGLFRKIFIEHVLCKEESKISVLDVLNFAVNKFPTGENEERERVYLELDVSDKICNFYGTVNDKNLAKQSFDILDSLFKSNKWYCYKDLICDVFVKTFDIPKINNIKDIDDFLSSLKNELDKYKEYNLIEDENILIEIFKARGTNITISQMFGFIDQCTHKDVLLAQSSIKFFEYLIANLKENNFYLQSGNIGILCELLDKANDKYCKEHSDREITYDKSNYKTLKPLVNYLADGCVSDINQFRVITKYCTNGDYIRSDFLDYSIADMQLLKRKVSQNLVKNNISDIAETTTSCIKCTHDRENESKQTAIEFFNLLLDGFTSHNVDLSLYQDANKQLILHLQCSCYSVQEYVELFAVKLCDKPPENLGIYRNKFAVDLEYTIKNKDCVNEAYKLWLANMYVLTRLFELPDLLLQNQKLENIVSQIFQSDKDKLKDLVVDCKNAIKIFLVTQVKIKKMTADQINRIAQRLNIEFDNRDLKLVQEYENNSNNQGKISISSDIKNLNSGNQIITDESNIINNTKKINTDNKANKNQNIKTNTSNKIFDKSGDSIRHQNKDSNRLPNYPLFYVMLILSIISLAVLIFAVIKLMWILIALASLCCIITSMFTYKNRPFCHNKLNKIDTVNLEEIEKKDSKKNDISHKQPKQEDLSNNKTKKCKKSF